MPGETDHRSGRSFNMLGDIFLEDVFGHAEGIGFRIQVTFLEVITVIAVQVTD